MKKSLLTLLTMTVILFAADAQQDTKATTDYRFVHKNSVQLEIGGHALAYSINYERNILNFQHFKTSLQLGVSFYPKFIDLRSRLWIPISVNQLFSFRRHHLETGVGVVLTQYQNYSIEGSITAVNKMEALLAAKVGYRYQRPDGRMQYKVLFTPLLEREHLRWDFHPLAAISVGYTFGH